jgi:hypothetical protein
MGWVTAPFTKRGEAMNEDQLFGHDGIDTDEERRRINYRPSSAYRSVNDVIGDSSQEITPTDDGDPLDDTLPTSEDDVEWVEKLMEMEDTINIVKDALESLKGEVLDTVKADPSLFTASHTGSVPNLTALDFEVPTADLPQLTELGLNKPYVTLDEYVDAIGSTERSPLEDAIVDTVEQYASDVYGSLPLELYPDVAELADWAGELSHLYQYLIKNTYPSKEAILAKEKAFAGLVEHYEDTESLYYNLLRESFEQGDYFDVVESYETVKREYEYELRGRKQIQESVQLLDTSLSALTANGELILEGLASGSQIDNEQVKVLLNKQESHPKIRTDRNNGMAIALKLSLNYYKQDIDKKTNILRNTASLPVAKRLHDQLIERKEVRNVVMTALQDQLHYLKDPSQKRSIELFFDEVGRGAQYMTNEYETMLQDTYRFHSLANDVRKEKLESILQKEHARVGYQIVATM